MNKKAIEGLKKEEEALNELKDLKSQIKDYEDELELVSGDSSPSNARYITLLMKRIDNLYIKLNNYEAN